MKKILLLLPLAFSIGDALAASSCNPAYLFNAAYAGNRTGIEQYAKKHCPINLKDSRGFTLYDIAALNGDAKLQQWLISQHAAKNGQYSPALIKLIQTGLRYLNYDAGPITGSLTPATTAAIKKYQKSIGAPANGRLSPQWLAHLNKALKNQTRKDLASLGYKSSAAFRAKRKLPNYNRIDDQLLYQIMMAQADNMKRTIDKKNTQKQTAAALKTKQTAERGRQQRVQPPQTQLKPQPRSVQAQRPPVNQRPAQRQPVLQAPIQRPTAQRPVQPPQVQIQAPPVQHPQVKIQAPPVQHPQVKIQAPPVQQPQVQIQTPPAQQPPAAARVQTITAEPNPQLNTQNSPAAPSRAERDQAELQSKMGSLVKEHSQTQTQNQFDAVQSSGYRAPASIPHRSSAPNSKTGGVPVNKKFNKLSGTLVFTGGENNCTVGGQKIDSSWCRTYYPSGENKQCDAVISKTGVVVSLRCK